MVEIKKSEKRVLQPESLLQTGFLRFAGYELVLSESINIESYKI